MPLFGQKKDKEKPSNNHNNNGTFADENSERQKSPSPTKNGRSLSSSSSSSSTGRVESPTTGEPNNPTVNRPKLVFHCQQAQGSPTGLISGFSNVKELYQKIADCYGFPVSDILFCTLNTHRIDMENLLSAQLCLDDFIFVHRKGSRKEVEVKKSEDALGLTITDNGTGYAFIKRIKEDSIIDRNKAINVGDHIEGIGDESLVGWRHVEVAKYLKAIPVGTTFTLRLVEPLKAGFANIGPKDSRKKPTGKSLGSGRETLRLRNDGPAQISQEPDNFVQAAIEKINVLLENFMGINDVDLATQIWEMAESKANTMDFAEAVDNSELESFGFTDDFIIEVWGIVTDAKSGRLAKTNGHGQSRSSPSKNNLFDKDLEGLNDEDLAQLMMSSTPASRRAVAK